ncbi:MAG: ABC transporter permease, partial [Planctomycetota bacterium]
TADVDYQRDQRAAAPDSLWRQALQSRRVIIGGAVLLVIAGLCVVTLPWTLFLQDSSFYYDGQAAVPPSAEPLAGGQGLIGLFGYDPESRSMLARSLLGGVISLAVGVAAAAISVVLGCGVGLLAGYAGGKVDAALMRFVDIMYGLPYILLVILFKVALEGPLEAAFEASGIFRSPASAASLAVMFLAIGLVSWLTMARVVRGQTLSLREQPFIEAARAAGLGPVRIFRKHLLPNLIGPIIVYATLTVPQAILQESFLSFLGIGVVPPLPSWGSLASDGLDNAFSPFRSTWWQLVFPCTLLAITLLALNFLGDGLRDLFDPKREAAKI